MGNTAVIIRRCGLTAAAIIGAIGISIFLNNTSTRANSSASNTPIALSYYTGMPSTLISYEAAYANGDPNVNKVEYTTQSTGRLAWNNTDDVYFDAADINLLASNLNITQEQYQQLYQRYLEAVSALQ